MKLIDPFNTLSRFIFLFRIWTMCSIEQTGVGFKFSTRNIRNHVSTHKHTLTNSITEEERESLFELLEDWNVKVVG